MTTTHLTTGYARSRWRVLAATGLLVLAVAGPAYTAVAAPAQTVRPGLYRAAARADSIRIELTDPGAPAIPKGEVLDAAPAVAQAEMDSTGVSQGYAAAPTPGAQVASLPLVVNGLLAGAGPPLPGYPFLVNSTHPAIPEQHQIQGPFRITTESNELGTTAESRLGALTGDDVMLGATTSFAKTTRDPETGVLVAEAKTVVTGFSIGPLLTLGNISGTAKVTTKPGEEPVVESSFKLGTLTVAGIEFGLTSKGLEPITGSLPGIQTAVLDQLLAPLGVTFDLMPAEEVAGGTDSGALKITFVQDVPTQGRVRVALTLGRALALSENAASRSSTLPSPGGGSFGSTAGSGFDLDVGSSAPPSFGGIPVAPTPAPSSGAGVPATVTRTSFSPFGAPDTNRLYLSLVGAAISAAAAGQVFGGGIRRSKQPADSGLTLAGVLSTSTARKGLR